MEKSERGGLFWLHLGSSAWLISVEGLPLLEVQIPTLPKAVKDSGIVKGLPARYTVGNLKRENQQNSGFEPESFQSYRLFLILYVVSWFIGTPS